MKVLQIYTYYPPENVASTHLKKDLTQAYVDAGFDLCVVTPVPSRGIDEKTYHEYRNRLNESLYNGKVEVHRFKAPREGKRTLQRTLRYLAVNVKQYRHAIKMKDIDIISSGSTPPTQGLICAKVKKKLGVPFVYNLQDIFPDSLVNAGMTKEGSIIWKIGRRIENKIYKAADRIIVISEDHKDNLIAKGVKKEKIIVIPNWVNVDNVYSIPRDRNILYNRFELEKDKFYITYCGNLGLSQNFSHLIEVAERIQDQFPEVCFILIGDGAEKEHIESIITHKGLKNIKIYPFQPYEDIAHVFSLGDASLVISKPGVAKSSVPSKTWSIMAAERPVLASFDEDSNLAELVRSVPCGLVAKPDDEKELVQNIERLLVDNNLRNQLGKNGKKYLVEKLNKDRCVSLYVNTLKEVYNISNKSRT